MKAVDRNAPVSAKYSTVNGKNLVVHCQAGLYEVLRKGLLAYYTNSRNHQFECETTCLKEKGSGLFVQTTHRFRNIGGNVAYTINLYHTKSILLVNGKGTDNFIDSDWPDIMNLIDTCAGNAPQLLNEQLRNCLVQLAGSISKGKRERNGKDQDKKPQLSKTRISGEFKQVPTDDKPGPDNEMMNSENALTLVPLMPINNTGVNQDKSIADSVAGHKEVHNNDNRDNINISDIANIAGQKMHAHDCSAPQTKAATTALVPELPATWKDPIIQDVHQVNATSCTNRTSTESPVHQSENATSNMEMTTDNTNGAVAERPMYSQKKAASHNHMSKASNRIDGTAIESPVNRQENAVSLLYINKAAKPKNEARTELPVSHQENAASHTRMSKASSGTSNAGVESMVYRQENNISRIHVRKTSGDINGTATDTMMNQPEQSCQSRNTLLALEREIKARERKVGAREKLVDQREKDLALKHTQYETARTCIIGYEARIKELENSNKVLQQLLDATRGHSPQQTPIHDNTSRMAPCQETTSTPYHGANSSNIQMQRDLSIKALKGTINNQLHAMGQRITNNHHQSALLQQQIQSSMFSQQLMSMIQTLHLKPAQYAPTFSTCPNHTATQASIVSTCQTRPYTKPQGTLQRPDQAQAGTENLQRQEKMELSKRGVQSQGHKRTMENNGDSQAADQR